MSFRSPVIAFATLLFACSTTDSEPPHASVASETQALVSRRLEIDVTSLRRGDVPSGSVNVTVEFTSFTAPPGSSGGPGKRLLGTCFNGQPCQFAFPIGAWTKPFTIDSSTPQVIGVTGQMIMNVISGFAPPSFLRCFHFGVNRANGELTSIPANQAPDCPGISSEPGQTGTTCSGTSCVFDAHITGGDIQPWQLGFEARWACVPTEEVCDGYDNDCNDLVDEGLTEECHGAWEGPFCWPALGVHAMHLHTGKILSWPHTSGVHTATHDVWTWDHQPACRGHFECPLDQPDCDTVDPACFTDLENDDTNLFCVGNTQLADGRILAVGGHRPGFPNNSGLPDANIFDPEDESWIGRIAGLDQMGFDRWYPTTTTLGDGKVLTVAGTLRGCVASGHECISHDSCYTCESHGDGHSHCSNDGAPCVSDVDCQPCVGGQCRYTGASCNDNLECPPPCANNVCQGVVPVDPSLGPVTCEADGDCLPCRFFDVVNEIEVFDPTAPGELPGNPPGRFTTLGESANLAFPIYAEMFLLPNGRVFFAGAEGPFEPFNSPLVNMALDLTTDPLNPQWAYVATSSVPGASAAMYEPGKILKVGGIWSGTVTSGAETIDLTSGSGSWEAIARMAAPRLFSNLTLLPDGTVMVSGGTRSPNQEYDYNCVHDVTGVRSPQQCSPAGLPPGRPGLSCPRSAGGRESGIENGTAAREVCPVDNPATPENEGQTCEGTGEQFWVSEVEIFDPENPDRGWVQMAPMVTPRMYHSSTVLLPDGTVASMGGGQGSGAVHDYSTLEIFRPPYLFKGARPTVMSAPDVIGYGETFSIETPDAEDIAKVSLIRLAATTHGTDQNARFLPMVFEAQAGSVEVSAVRVGASNLALEPNIAPPGYYMLFLVNSAGVPSIGRYVLIASGLSCASDEGCQEGEFCNLGTCETRECDPEAPFEAPVAAFTGSMDADGLTFSADGQTAYISGAGTGNRDIFVATRNPTTGLFGTPTPLAVVNTGGIERAPSLSPDGKLYFTQLLPGSNYEIARALGTGPLFSGHGVVSAINSPYQEEDPYWWNSNTLYFVSERETQGAHRDIYVTTLGADGVTFSTPTRVPSVAGTIGLHSNAEEFRPVLSPDGLTLYFGSARHGIGSDTQGDVWMARRTAATEVFAAPVNLWGMNSTGTDLPVTVSANGCTLYFTSNEETGLSNSPNMRLYQATRGTSTPAQVTLRLNILGQGSVTTAPFNCGPGNTGTCSASRPPDTTMILLASGPAGWTGTCTGNGSGPSTDGVVVFSQNAVCTIKFPGAPLVGQGGLCALSNDCQQGLRCVNNTCG